MGRKVERSSQRWNVRCRPSKRGRAYNRPALSSRQREQIRPRHLLKIPICPRRGLGLIRPKCKIRKRPVPACIPGLEVLTTGVLLQQSRSSSLIASLDLTSFAQASGLLKVVDGTIRIVFYSTVLVSSQLHGVLLRTCFRTV